MRQVALVTVGEIGSGAYEAHVLGLARRLSPHALVHQVALVGPSLLATAAGRRELARQRALSGSILSGEIVMAPHEPHRFGPRWSSLQVARALQRIRRGPGPVVLHCRGYTAALAAG